MRKTFLNAVLFSAAFATAAGTLVSCKDYDDDIASLQDQINQKATASELTSQLATLSSDLSAAKSDLNNQISSLKGLVETVEKSSGETAAALLKTMEEKLAAADEAQKNALTSQIAVLKQAIADSEKGTNAKVADLQKTLDTKLAELQKSVDAKMATIDEAQKKIAALSEEIKKANEAQMAELTKKVEAVAKDVTEIVGKRLTSLVFAPTTYVDGIETIKFASLDYADWGNDPKAWLADAAKKGAKINVIDDATTEAVYYVSPSSINANLIEKLEFLANTATNLHTRAAADEAPIKVVGKPVIENGKMTLKLQKNTASKFNFKRANNWTYVWNEETKQFEGVTYTIDKVSGEYVTAEGYRTWTDDKGKEQHELWYNQGVDGKGNYGIVEDEFTIVSLKATNKLNDAEVKAGVNPDVFSDWARLAEVTTRPFIHNKKAVNKKGLEENNPNSSWTGYTPNDTISHFWSYTEAYGTNEKGEPNAVNAELPWDYNYRTIAFEANYNEPFDLSKVVTVCDAMGNEIDAASYGMEFKFDLMDYKLKNQNQTGDATNQKNFAKWVDEDHTIIESTARDGETTNNRDAIGREPMIQVVLKDTKNKGVIDVRYFKIHWVAETAVKNYDFGTLNEKKYACDVELKDTIFEAKVNGMLTFLNMSKSEFRNAYRTNGKLYDTAEKAAAGVEKTENAKLGTFAILNDMYEQGQTMNFEWTLNTANQKATQAEYEAGKKFVTGYARFTSDAYGVLVVKLVKELTIDKIAYAKGLNYAQEQWDPAGVTMANAIDNANKTTYVNPSLRSDLEYGKDNFTDAQLVRTLLMSYINNGKTPTSVPALLNGVESFHKLIFDKDRLAEVATATNTKAADWTVSKDGATLKYKTSIAATIDQETGVIQLNEGATPGKNGQPTEGALLLVGKSVPVIVGGDGCDFTQVVDKYLVNFMTPLVISGIEVTDKLVDIIDGADSSIDLTDKVMVKEAFGLERTIVGPAKKLDKEAADLCKWYIVETPVYGEGILTNLNKNGGIDAECKTKLADLKNQKGEQKYRVWVEKNADGKMLAYFHNASGAAIAQDFKVMIPVTVKTKWGVVTAYATIDIVKGNYGK